MIASYCCVLNFILLIQERKTRSFKHISLVSVKSREAIFQGGTSRRSSMLGFFIISSTRGTLTILDFNVRSSQIDNTDICIFN